MIEAAAAETGPAWWPAEVVDHDRRTPDIAVLAVKPAEPYPYLAGQHAAVQVSRWPRVWRPYSIANAPRADGLLRFHVRAVTGGWVSDALVRHTRIGDTVMLASARGTATLRPDGERDLLCVGGGTGLAPLKALVEQIVRSGGQRNVQLLVGARTERELYDMPELRMLESLNPFVRVVPVVSAEPTFDGMCGTLPEVLDRFRSFADRDIYVSGPPGMITATLQRLAEMDVPADHVRYDAVPDSTADHSTGRVPVEVTTP
jgi:NAD(P)H-flavin reductase